MGEVYESNPPSPGWRRAPSHRQKMTLPTPDVALNADTARMPGLKGGRS
jgi:hypothetical protein